MAGSVPRTIALCLAAFAFMTKAASPLEQTPAMPAVAVVLSDGKLLPLGAFPAGGWRLLPWPHHDVAQAQPSAPVPASVAAIPRSWFAPLPALPVTWRLQPINGRATVVHAASPTRWQVASFDAVGLATDYVDPDPKRRSFDFNAGLAVTGDVETLPITEFDESSSEWAHLVARHAKAFVAADRAEAKRRGLHMKGRSTVVAAKELRDGDVSLYRVEIDPKHHYQYFEVVVQRPFDLDGTHPACANPSVEYHGLIERRGRADTVRWVATAPPTCGEPTETREVIGGLRDADGVQLVVEDTSDDWQTFAILRPDALSVTSRRHPRGGFGQ
jgi:hypothetical protein